MPQKHHKNRVIRVHAVTKTNADISVEHNEFGMHCWEGHERDNTGELIIAIILQLTQFPHFSAIFPHFFSFSQFFCMKMKWKAKWFRTFRVVLFCFFFADLPKFTNFGKIWRFLGLFFRSFLIFAGTWICLAWKKSASWTRFLPETKFCQKFDLKFFWQKWKIFCHFRIFQPTNSMSLNQRVPKLQKCCWSGIVKC